MRRSRSSPGRPRPSARALGPPYLLEQRFGRPRLAPWRGRSTAATKSPPSGCRGSTTGDLTKDDPKQVARRGQKRTERPGRLWGCAALSGLLTNRSRRGPPALRRLHGLQRAAQAQHRLTLRERFHEGGGRLDSRPAPVCAWHYKRRPC